MSIDTATTQGSLLALWRYPVKSMRGEELDSADVADRGLVGDRAYAMIDQETGKVVSAKNPRKWANLFEFQAAFAERAPARWSLPPARIIFPDGSTAATNDPAVEGRLSDWVGRRVRLTAVAPESAQIEGYSPDHDWLAARDQVFEVTLPSATFFDCALVHLITTATLKQLAALAPRSRFEVPRFRPNLVINVADQADGFVENDWVGRTLAIGNEVRLKVTKTTERCVMTTLPQRDLPKDPDVLRTAVQKNDGNVGVYASVIQGGRVRRGDAMVVS
jgi:uncharacterized protein YcbX